ncbi:hypothetical protein [Aquimarina aggregata]|nr:hypothetical protein [Aquimarina aggregata]
MADKNKDSISFSKEKQTVKIKYVIRNNDQNYILDMSHLKFKKNSSFDHFKYLLPQEMINSFFEMGNAKTIADFKKEVLSLDSNKLDKFIRQNTNYYGYFDSKEKKFKTDTRNTVFVFFKNDLDNEYIECYELKLTSMPITIID